MNKLNFLPKLAITSTVILFSYVSDSQAGTVTATRGKLSGRVSVTGAVANDSDKTVEQSTRPGGTTFIDTGSRIDTDATGSGSVGISNVSSGTLLKGHNVRVICTGGVICGPAIVTASRSWFASFKPGQQQSVNIEVPQSNVGDDGLGFLETWESGSIWSLILDPSEASWIDTGFATISSSEGDLLTNIVNITSNAISFEILSDPTPLTNNSIFINGVDLNVLPGIRTITPMYSLIGNTSSYLDGNLLLNQSLSGEIVSVMTISSVPEPKTIFGLLAIGGLGFGLKRQKQS